MTRPRCFATFALAIATTLSAQEPTKDIRSSDVEKRLAAVKALVEQKPDDAAKLLISALKDKDWEMRERAAAALGELGDAVALKKLAEVALKGSVLRLRATAADAIAKIDATAGTQLLIKKATGKKTAVVACEALSRIWAQTGTGPTDKLTKILEHKEVAIRHAAAIAWLAGNADRATALATLLTQPDKVVRAAALDLVQFAPRREDLDTLALVIGGRVQKDTIERRAIRAAVAVVMAAEEGVERDLSAKALLEAAAKHQPRLARLAAQLHQFGAIDQEKAIAQLEIALGGDAGGRAAAAKALGQVGGDQAGLLAARHYDAEPEDRVRYQLVDAFMRTHDAKSDDTGKFLASAARDRDARVRERAVVWLGTRGVPGAVDTLLSATSDPAWTVGVAAIVSLGKTYQDAAVAPLEKLAKSKDWRQRGAAAVGLMHLNRKAVIDTMIDLVADDNPSVARAAHFGLVAIFSLPDAKFDKSKWQLYWSGLGGKFLFQDRKQADENRKKYGYQVPDRDIYKGLDVIVFLSRPGGDHIEHVLDNIEVPYRTTKAKEIASSGPHPEAVFVVNCAAEIGSADIEPLQWFLHTGGSLFGSCWALEKTIEQIYPGVIKKLHTPRGEVLGDVRACACRSDSPYLNGVFGHHVTPIYHLEGAHLIQVIDPERAEVLIDSPDATQAYGGGNLAAWFQVGHGVVLDSANHFDLQGLAKAEGLKTAGDRQVYAMDHMGLTYERWREVKRKSYWKSAGKSADEVPDRSTFRIVTNFVRSKRIGG